MKSYDLFGTLVAGRDPYVRDGDQPHHVPIQENILKVQTADLIISDFYDSQKAWQVLRDVAGLEYNDMHVSHDDKATGKIWDQLNAQGRCPSLHTGDDRTTDYDSPRSRGIQCELTTIAKLTRTEEWLNEIGLPTVSRIVREARLRTWHEDSELRKIQLFQINCNFPFLYAASLWFHRKMISGKYARLLMSSRDCFLWKKIQDRIAGEKYEVFYWYTSRLTRYKPSISYLAYCRQLFLDHRVLMTDVCGFGNSLMSWDDPKFGHDVCLLVGYPTDGKSILPCVLTDWIDESANLARHPMIVDVMNGEPVYWQDGIDWIANPYINAMHDAFDVCIAAMENYPFPNDVEDLDGVLAKLLSHMGDNYRAIQPLTAFRREEAIRAAELLKDIEGVVI